MSNRLRGMAYACKAGRLHEYILLRFGSYDKYYMYIISRFWLTWRNKAPHFEGIPIIKTNYLVEEPMV